MQRVSSHRFSAALRLSISHQLHVIFKLQSCLGVILAGNKVHDQGVLDGKDRVIVQVLILAIENLGGQRAVAFLGGLCACISLGTSSQRERGEN